MSGKPPIINCHTHIFTGDHVPPYLAKTFVPWPFYYLFSLKFIVWLFRFWYNYPYAWQFKSWYKAIQLLLYKIKIAGRRSGLTRLLYFIIGILLSIQVFYILYDWLGIIQKPGGAWSQNIQWARQWLKNRYLLFIPPAFWGKCIMVLLLVLFFKPGRNIIFFLLKKIWSFLGLLPGPKTKELAKRYLNIGRFAFHRHQKDILKPLKGQYPPQTGLIILPMDMEFMAAGRLKTPFQYEQQMLQLFEIKSMPAYRDYLFPFVFADPRRMRKEKEVHFDYEVENGQVTLKPCFIQDFLEEKKFSGIKIYPALGYYPFEEELLPLWKYAADRGIPVLTHCIRGIIHYRGIKKKEWDQHPVFQEKIGEVFQAMPLMEIKNRDFTNNFTHPLNYLCLLEEQMLRKLVQQAKNQRIRELFGYTDENTPLQYNLNHLKLCIGHFGGDDEWNRFLELDRDNYTGQLVRNPFKGIDFLKNNKGELSLAKPAELWRKLDWYSIICSLILQYPNVYADISYIVHNPAIQPLLKQTLLNEKLKQRVLFGTDFYVVRNHKSEKNILMDMVDQLSEQEFDQIARINPRAFLHNQLHGPIKI